MTGPIERDYSSQMQYMSDEMDALRAQIAALQERLAQERERCIKIVENYRVSVGNSAAGERAAEWTMENLREIRDEIRSLK